MVVPATPIDLRQVKAIVTDARILGELDPKAVETYLSSTGWNRVRQRRTGSAGSWCRSPCWAGECGPSCVRMTSWKRAKKSRSGLPDVVKRDIHKRS